MSGIWGRFVSEAEVGTDITKGEIGETFGSGEISSGVRLFILAYIRQALIADAEDNPDISRFPYPALRSPIPVDSSQSRFRPLCYLSVRVKFFYPLILPYKISLPKIPCGGDSTEENPATGEKKRNVSAKTAQIDGPGNHQLATKLFSGSQYLSQLLISRPPLCLSPSVLHVCLSYHVLHPDPLHFGTLNRDHCIGSLMHPPLLPRKLRKLLRLFLNKMHRLEG